MRDAAMARAVVVVGCDRAGRRDRVRRSELPVVPTCALSGGAGACDPAASRSPDESWRHSRRHSQNHFELNAMQALIICKRFTAWYISSDACANEKKRASHPAAARDSRCVARVSENGGRKLTAEFPKTLGFSCPNKLSLFLEKSIPP
jgi:hypothetical protein